MKMSLRCSFTMLVLSLASSASAFDLGLLPIGDAPKTMESFIDTTCNRVPDSLSDCNAADSLGRKYSFFGGKLSKVTVSTASGMEGLPPSIQLGVPLERAAQCLSHLLGVKVDLSPRGDGQGEVYSTDFVVPSSSGVMTSIELIGDADGLLIEVTQRTDF